MSRKKGKKLTLDDRSAIYAGIAAKKSFPQIADELNVAPSTIYREVKANRTSSNPQGIRNFCRKQGVCTKEQLCKKRSECIKRCSKCKERICNTLCTDFDEFKCRRLETAPYCCNECKKTFQCRFRRHYYRVSKADKKARARRSDSRQGIDACPTATEPAIANIVARLSKGQSPAHIWAHIGDDIPFSKRSFYRHVQRGNYGLNAFNLPRKVRYKQRSKTPETKFDPRLEGRTYSDWLSLDEEDRLHTVQIDCIKGKRGESAAILSILFPLWRFQMFLKLEREDALHVSAAFDALEHCLGKDDFARLFKTVLADRGSGFPSYKSHEKSVFGGRRMTMYFCDARRPEQKGACEKNHVEFRRIVPKGSAIGHLGSFELAHIMSHINSYTRASLGGKTPYNLASQHLCSSLLEALGIEDIDPSEVVLKPYLLKVVQAERSSKERGEK